jgi:hypothetical protein
MILRVVRYDITDHLDTAESAEKADPAEPMENADAKDPTEPIDRHEPMEPMERSEPFEPIDRSESSDHSDHRDRAPEDVATPHILPVMRLRCHGCSSCATVNVATRFWAPV